MCGVAGFFPCPKTEKSISVLKSMSDVLSHRGPDANGVWTDGKIGLAHSRLSILDLESGIQPMKSQSNRFVISYNGEVYNYKVLREKLISRGISFKTGSDTEVVLESIEFWGLNKSLLMFKGMFAFALWDTRDQILTLVRDRMGEKPMYYSWQNKTFIFASELRPLKCHPNWQTDINRYSLAKLLQYNYIPSPHSIYSDVYKLEPGTLLKVNFSNNNIKQSKEKWFSYSKLIKDANLYSFSGGFNEATSSLDGLLNERIGSISKADVPVGVFLSGGIDSSLIASIMQSQSNLPIETFTMGYEDSDYDESVEAKKYSKYLGTNHNEMIITASDAISLVPSLCNVFDEPFADASQIPTMLVSALAKNKVKVVLSGDGADEIFGGYNRYFFGNSIYKFIKFSPNILNKVFSKCLKVVSPEKWDRCFLMLNTVLFQSEKTRHPGEKIHKISSLLLVNNEYDFYSKLVSMWFETNPVILDKSYNTDFEIDIWSKKESLSQNMMNMDVVSYLPEDILVKVDRSTMSVGLESRAPYLDYDIVKFASKLPIDFKINNKKGKLILRNLLNNYIPQSMHSQTKKGFSAPIHEWIRGPLREWSEELLSEESLKNQGLMDVAIIRNCWKKHLSGENNNQYLLWSVLMFQSWYKNEHH